MIYRKECNLIIDYIYFSSILYSMTSIKNKKLNFLQNNPRIMSLRVLAHNHLKYVEILEMIYKTLKLDRKMIDECFVEYIDIFDLIDEILDNRENCINILNKYKFLFKGDELPNNNIDNLF